MKIIFILTFYFACLNAHHYTLTAPNKFRQGASYRFMVTVHGVMKARVNLVASIEDPLNSRMLVVKSFEIELDSSYNFEFDTPEVIPEGRYDFVVHARGDINFDGRRGIEPIRKAHSLFIQTDKYLYKPGQKVLYRIIGINADLKPYTQPINLTIYDKSDNIIHVHRNQRNFSGVINGHLQLSDVTPLGQWRIEAKSKGSTQVAYFQVAEYVLPKYEVNVILPKYFLINVKNPSIQKPLHITTTATYTFGKPVKGFALITVKPNQFSNSPQFISKNVELVDGKADISLTLEEVKVLYPRGFHSWAMHELFVQSNVTEAATGMVLQGNSTCPIKDNKYQLTFLSISADNFKPGHNYKAYIQLSQVDGSEPIVADIKNPDETFKSLNVKITGYRSIYTRLTPPVYPWQSQQISVKKNINFPLLESLPVSVRKNINVPLVANGLILFEVPTDNLWTEINLEVSFLDVETKSIVSATKRLKSFGVRDKRYIQLSLIGSGEAIKPKSSLTLNIKTNELLTTFYYQVLGKGEILLGESRSLSIPSDNTNFSISISPDVAVRLAPTATVVVFYITSTGEFVADSIALSVTDYFTNKVSISFDSKSASPGEDVTLRVNAAENSYVFFLAVDQSVLLLSARNDITQNMVEKDMSSYAGATYNNDIFPFRRFCWPIFPGGADTFKVLEKAGLFVLTDYFVFSTPRIRYYRRYGNMGINNMRKQSVARNINEDTLEKIEMDKPELPSPQEKDSPRKNFPETWIWSDVTVGSDGFMEIKYKVPDTITSWIATAFATNENSGLGIADQSAKVTAIKPFFISLGLPYSIVRGEQFALQVTLFNYYGEDLMVDVTLVNSNFFQVIKCVNGKESFPVNEDASKNILVANNDMVTIYFWIVVTSLGQIPIEVRAVAGVAADALKVNLLVKPEGQPQVYSSSSLLRIPPDTSSVDFDVSLPSSDVLVPGSVEIEASVMGDILGSTINNLDKLLAMPYGCGEQNMVTLAPDVYILKYLSVSNQLTDDIKNKASTFINAGYQRELTYQRIDGSFSAFGDRDPSGSVWLSAFVSKVFREASGYIPVDDINIGRCLTWMLQHQDSNGAFKEPPGGKVIHTAMQGGASSGIGLTAYVTISLLVNKNIPGIPNIQEKVKRSLSYLETRYHLYSSDSYALSIIAYAFYLASSTKLTHVLQLLDSLSVRDESTTHWSKDDSKTSPVDSWKPPYREARGSDIEMTSYVLLVYASMGDVSKSIPVAKWLISKRNAWGGFVSTQDTVIGLEALATFSGSVMPPINSEGLMVSVTQDGNRELYSFAAINRNSALILQSHQLPTNTTKVTFSATGQGMAIVQINVKYYINSPNTNQLLKQDLNVSSNNAKLDLRVCSSWSGTEVTGMILTEVNVLTGYSLSSGYADILAKDLGGVFKRYEFSGTRLSVYLDELTKDDLCFTVKLEKVFYVNNVKPALVKTYRYYSPGDVASGYYSLASTSQTANVCDPAFNK